jgi:hypothetical protein
VLKAIGKARLPLDIKKCEFNVKITKYLRFIIKVVKGLRIDSKKIKAIKK